MQIEAYRDHEFSYGHRVYGHENKCAHLHGHNGKVRFYCSAISGKLDKVGRVIDFSVIKQIACQWLEDNWDHKMIIYSQDPILPALLDLDPKGVVELSLNPTAENLSKILLEVTNTLLLEKGIQVDKIEFYETSKCGCTVELDPTVINVIGTQTPTQQSPGGRVL